MTVTPFNGRPSAQSSLVASPELPSRPPYDDDRKEQAIAQLVEHGVLSHALGRHGEYKVRTTMTTRQNWQYRCSVLRHGKAIKGIFLPIIVEQPSPFKGITIRPQGAEDIRLRFAEEAVDVHFTRCAALREYLVLSALYDQPSSRSRGWYALLAPLMGIAVVVVYGFWTHALRTEGSQPPASPPSLVADRPSTSESWNVPLLPSSSTASGNSASVQDRPSSPIAPPEAPKTIRLSDLFAMQDFQQKPDRASRVPTSVAFEDSARADIQAGDVLLLTGWIHRVSRAPDNTYRLSVSPTRNPGGRTLLAMLPPPDQVSDSSTLRTQLQTARTFIRQELLRQQEPSPRGSVMRRPILVQLSGHLSIPASSLVAAAPGKRPKVAAANWEISPVLEVRFAVAPEPTDRPQSQ
jgi:hypothetical protein